LVWLRAWKTPEERNRHCTGLLAKREIELDQAFPGRTLDSAVDTIGTLERCQIEKYDMEGWLERMDCPIC